MLVAVPQSLAMGDALPGGFGCVTFHHTPGLRGGTESEGFLIERHFCRQNGPFVGHGSQRLGRAAPHTIWDADQSSYIIRHGFRPPRRGVGAIATTLTEICFSDCESRSRPSWP